MYAAVLHKYTARAVEKIGKLVAAGLDAHELMGLNSDGFFGMARRLRADLINRRERIVHFGRLQVADEIKRQQQPSTEGSFAGTAVRATE